MVLGLDCMTPDLLFNKLTDRLPNLKKLMDMGLYGPLRSTTPPLTIPAWLSMMSGQDPGRLGLYGFRHRVQGSYQDMWIPTARAVDPPTVWKIAGEHGKRSMVIGVPPSFPPKKIEGIAVGCFLTPGTESNYTCPLDFKDEIERVVGDYFVDVRMDRENKTQLVKNIKRMAKQRFDLIDHLVRTQEWDFFIFVEIGIDRLHHAFWRFLDPKHPHYEDDEWMRMRIMDFYEYVDNRIGLILSKLDEDTIVIAASDHGAKSLQGNICLNEWLIQEGYLVLKEYPDNIRNVEQVKVDWSKTKVWAWGGYYGRIFFNIKGREPEGIVTEGEISALKKELKEKLEILKDEDGKHLNTQVLDPYDIYNTVNGDPPDLMVFFDDLNWRVAGNIGFKKIYLKERSQGPEDAVHDWNGIYVLYDPKYKFGRELGPKSIMDIGPTILKLLDLPIPKDIDGKVIEEFFN